MEVFTALEKKLFIILKKIGNLYSNSTNNQASLLSLVANEFKIDELINNGFKGLSKRKYYYVKIKIKLLIP